MIRLAWFVGLCAVLVTTSAYPQNRAGNVYVGAALGMTWYPELEEGVGDFENELRREGFTDFELSTSSDERAFAWNLFAGYAVSEVFAIEAGYLGSGKVSMGLDLSGMHDGTATLRHRCSSEAMVIVWRPRRTCAHEFARQTVRQDWNKVVGR